MSQLSFSGYPPSQILNRLPRPNHDSDESVNTRQPGSVNQTIQEVKNIFAHSQENAKQILCKGMFGTAQGHLEKVGISHETIPSLQFCSEKTYQLILEKNIIDDRSSAFRRQGPHKTSCRLPHQ